MSGHCTCGPFDATDPYYVCDFCEHREEWRDGRLGVGDPSCPNCHGHGWYADGDALAGVQWPQTCDCVSPLPNPSNEGGARG